MERGVVSVGVGVPDNVMLWTMGVIRASQHVRPRASAASTSGKNRTANICSCLRALFSLKTNTQTHAFVEGVQCYMAAEHCGSNTYLLNSCSSCVLSSITS